MKEYNDEGFQQVMKDLTFLGVTGTIADEGMAINKKRLSKMNSLQWLRISNMIP